MQWEALVYDSCIILAIFASFVARRHYYIPQVLYICKFFPLWFISNGPSGDNVTHSSDLSGALSSIRVCILHSKPKVSCSTISLILLLLV